MRIDQAIRKFETVVAKSAELEEMLRTTLGAASDFGKRMVKAQPILRSAVDAGRKQQARLDEFTAMMRDAAGPMSTIGDSSKAASGLVKEIGQILIQMQD